MKKVEIPEGTSGAWRVERFDVSESEARFANIRGRYIRPGTYTRLMRGGTVVMSDTPAEMNDHYMAVRHAKDHVLIHGLGLGMVLDACLEKPNVSKATVIELSEEVISLVAPFYKAKWGDKVEIIHADALVWTPPKQSFFGMVWHDIWDYICADNLDDMKRLHRRYGRRCEWQGSWARELIRS